MSHTLRFHRSHLLSLQSVFLVITLCLFGNSLFGQQISNAGFENWSGATVLEPDSFSSSEIFNQGTVSRTPDAHSGQFAAKLYNGSSTALLAYTSSISTGGGWPFTSRPSGFEFWYKYDRRGTDTALGEVVLYKWMNNQQTVIGAGVITITSSATSYVQASVTIDYAAGALQPDSILVVFTPSLTTMGGSTFIVDDISLVYSTGIGTPRAEDDVYLYPNPATDILHVSLPQNSKRADVTITNLSGQSVYSIKDANGPLNLDCGSWPNGLYIATIKVGNFTINRRFIRNK